MDTVKMYLLEINTPGIVVNVPNSKEMMRTPIKRYIPIDDMPLWEATIRLKGISNYTIEVVEVNPEDLKRNNDPKSPHSALKKLGETGVHLGLSFKGRGKG